jgi:flagellar biosynthesis chaperone FliJ
MKLRTKKNRNENISLTKYAKHYGYYQTRIHGVTSQKRSMTNVNSQLRTTVQNERKTQFNYESFINFCEIINIFNLKWTRNYVVL